MLLQKALTDPPAENIDPTQRYTSMDWVHPAARRQFLALRQDLENGYWSKRLPVYFAPFETFRTPWRQRHLLQGPKTSNADAFQSAHQFGLAVDFVPMVAGHWTWDVPDDAWEGLRLTAERFGLSVPIAWDKAHVEHPLWKRISSLKA